MPVRAAAKITAWSYSRLKDYVKCALYARFKHVDKRKEPGSKAMDDGNVADKDAELYSTGQTSKCPPTLKLFEEDFKALRKIAKKLHVQENLALTRAWTVTDWFGPTAWVRIKMDCWYDVSPKQRKVIDYKNGKIRGEDLDQLELYAIAAFVTAPASTEEVITELWYLKEGVIVPEDEAARVFKRAEIPALKAKWEKKVAPMLADSIFKASPGNHCGWCFFSAKKSGPCKF